MKSEKCLNTEFFLACVFLYTDCVFGHFSRSDSVYTTFCFSNLFAFFIIDWFVIFGRVQQSEINRGRFSLMGVILMPVENHLEKLENFGLFHLWILYLLY